MTSRNSVSNEEFNTHLKGTNNCNRHNVNTNNKKIGRKCDNNTFSVCNQCDINNSSNINCSISDKILINSDKEATRIETISEIIQSPNKVVWKNEISAIYGGKTYHHNNLNIFHSFFYHYDIAFKHDRC